MMNNQYKNLLLKIHESYKFQYKIFSRIIQSKIRSKLKDLKEFKTKNELENYLDTLELSELLETYYIQLCEIRRIIKIVLDSVRDKQ